MQPQGCSSQGSTYLFYTNHERAYVLQLAVIAKVLARDNICPCWKAFCSSQFNLCLEFHDQQFSLIHRCLVEYCKAVDRHGKSCISTSNCILILRNLADTIAHSLKNIPNLLKYHIFIFLKISNCVILLNLSIFASTQYFFFQIMKVILEI